MSLTFYLKNNISVILTLLQGNNNHYNKLFGFSSHNVAGGESRQRVVCLPYKVAAVSFIYSLARSARTMILIKFT